MNKPEKIYGTINGLTGEESVKTSLITNNESKATKNYFTVIASMLNEELVVLQLLLKVQPPRSLTKVLKK